jgi:hypothetical protein
VEIESPKCVLVVAEELPVGLAANVAAVLAITLGHRVESIVGPDAIDGSGQAHAGLIKITLPILKAQKESIKQIREKASAMPGLFVVDVTEPAQTERTYSNYLEKMTTLSAEQLGYLGVALYGSKKLVNKLTGNLPLLQ